MCLTLKFFIVPDPQSSGFSNWFCMGLLKTVLGQWQPCLQVAITFNNLDVFLTYYIYAFHLFVRINSDYFPKRHLTVISVTKIRCVFLEVETDLLGTFPRNNFC